MRRRSAQTSRRATGPRTGAALRLAILAAFAALVAMPSVPQRIEGCGPDLPEAVFVVPRRPDVPPEAFAAGQIGVLQPTWYQRYLCVAWRHLRGLPAATTADLAVSAPAGADPAAAARAWAEARARVPGVAKMRPPDPYRWLDLKDAYVQILQFPADAFRNASATLEARIERFGAESPEVRAWVDAQDRVFADRQGDLASPPAAAPDAPALVRADRAYQAAAAAFYDGDFDAAVAGFEAVAGDADSPWRTMAPYLVARALTRKGTLGGGYGAADTTALAAAARQIDRVLGDPALADVHEPARDLASYLRVRLHPVERLRELCVAVATPDPGEGLGDDIEALTRLLDRFRQAEVESLATADPAFDPADWILTFQSGSASAHAHAIARMRDAPHWAAVAIARAQPDDSSADALLAAAAAATPGTPAWPTLSAHRARLLVAAGRDDDAHALLDLLLDSRDADASPSFRNMLLELRLPLAGTMEAFLADVPRRPAGLGFANGIAPLDSATLAGIAYPGATCFGEDGALCFQRALPLDVLQEIAVRSSLPAHMRAQVAFTTWARAVLLERHDVARALAPTVSSLLPALAERMDTYVEAPDDDVRRFAAVDLMLHAPGARPSVEAGLGRLEPVEARDMFRDNWWCATDPVGNRNAPPWAHDALGGLRWVRESVTPGTQVPTPAAWKFLDPATRARAVEEVAALEKVPAAPTWMARQVVEWAKRAPDDPRLPEALHLAVQATRYGCPDEANSDLSRAAFRVLHDRYPNSPWTEKTPHWY